MRTPVLVVGAGPAGLTAAVALARHDIEVTVVERRRELSGLPRAATVSTRTMELMRAWGLQDAIRAGGVEVEWRQWVGRTLRDAGETRPMGFPTREQSAVLSPAAPASVPQDHIEPVLLEHLRSSGVARVRFGTELDALRVRPDGVDVTLRDTATGASRSVRAGHVVAADGARSRVRAALGIGTGGPGSLSQAVATQFRAPLWELLTDRRYGLYAVTRPDAPGVFVPAGRGDRWIHGVESDVDGPPVTAFSAEEATRLIRLGAGVATLQPRIERIGTFTFAARLADRFREGPVFLVGDAAHQVTPRGGTGMNTAIHSAHDLGWKLAWVLRGWASPALLDTYEAERRPVAAHNVARSGDPLGGTRTAAQELAADLGGRIPHVWTSSAGPSGADGVSTLDLLGPGLTLFVAPAGGTWRGAAAAVAASGTAPPVDVHDVDPMTARGLGIPAGGALLARPDGAPAGCWPRGVEPVTALRAAVAAVTGTSTRLRRSS